VGSSLYEVAMSARWLSERFVSWVSIFDEAAERQAHHGGAAVVDGTSR
jgi:hypothetical protein